MKVTETREIFDFIRMCDDSYKKGWNEANGGNASHILSDECVKLIKKEFTFEDNWLPIGKDFELKNLKSKFIIITGSGRCFRDIKLFPEENIAIIEVSEDGTMVRKVWGLTEGGKTTMETPTHLLTLDLKYNDGYNTILHSHTPNVNALTFILDLNKETFSQEIWEMITECAVVFPKGIEVVPWMVCGTEEIGLATMEKMGDVEVVVWAHHGTFCAGKSCGQSFGLLETLEKSSNILLKVLAAGGKKNKITSEQVQEIRDHFNVK